MSKYMKQALLVAVVGIAVLTLLGAWMGSVIGDAIDKAQ